MLRKSFVGAVLTFFELLGRTVYNYCAASTRKRVMMQSRHFYIVGFSSVVFITLLLLLAPEVLPGETRPDTIKPVRWPGHQGSSEHEDPGRKVWKDTNWSQFAYVQYVTNLPIFATRSCSLRACTVLVASPTV